MHRRVTLTDAGRGYLGEIRAPRSLAVCSPRLCAVRRTDTATDLTRVPLLPQTNQPAAWPDWFAAAGVEIPVGSSTSA